MEIIENILFNLFAKFFHLGDGKTTKKGSEVQLNSFEILTLRFKNVCFLGKGKLLSERELTETIKLS